MNKVAIVLSLVSLLCCPNFANASLVKYNITGGVDTAGYSFSGFVFIESDPIVTEREPGAFSSLSYEIGPFLFESEGGISMGNSGSLEWFYNSSNELFVTQAGTPTFYIDTIINFVEKDNLTTWMTRMMGIRFPGVETSLEAYTHLPEIIVICTELMLGFDEKQYWGPSGAARIELSRAEYPVPEPNTILLFGTGIAGLAFVGRKGN